MRITLTCEQKRNPVCVSLTPVFGWTCERESAREGSVQLAYRIMVRDTQGVLCWDSGRVESDRCAFIPYGGEPLQSHSKYYWTTEVYTDGGVFQSDDAYFVTCISEGDWVADWICEDRCRNAPVFTKEFELRHRIDTAYAYVCGLGYFELYINGKKVGDDYFVPNRTDYDKVRYENLKYPFHGVTKKVCNYLGYDVASYLRVGKNKVEILLGNGWYRQTERVVEGSFVYDSLKTVFQLHCDGVVIKSDSTWRVRNSRITRNNIFYGETYAANETDDGLYPVRIARPPIGVLKPQLAPADRVRETIRPTPLPNGVYDLGKNITGFVRIKVRGQAGDRVSIYYTEMLDQAGLPDFTSTVGYEPSDRMQIQKDEYILGSSDTEEYTPHFVWHGFRYFRIVSEHAEILDAVGLYVAADAEKRGSFCCSSELLNQIHEIYVNAQISNMHGAVPSDCPHRERIGYTGDGQVSSLSAMYNYDTYNLYRKWIADIAGTQNEKTGFVAHTAPFNGGGGGPSWGSSIVIVPWNLYMQYGDPAILEENIDAIRKWIGYLKGNRNASGLVYREEEGSWCLGEWCLPTGKTWSEPQPEEIKVPNELVNSTVYIYCMQLYCKMLRILGRSDETVQKDLQEAQDAVNRAYLTDFYSNGIQGCDVFPLFCGIVPEQHEKHVFEHVLTNLREHGNHFDTGMFGTRCLLYVLDRYDRNDVALEMLGQTDYPSYGNMVKQGATALWETWEGNGSQNHTALGGFDSWFYECLAGIRPVEEHAGFGEFSVRPYFSDTLSYVHAELKTVYGILSVGWQRTAEGICLRVTVPFNTRGHIHLPHGTTDVGCGTYEYLLPADA